jgi:hypothetical protein
MAKCDLMSTNTRWLCRQYMGCIESFLTRRKFLCEEKEKKKREGNKKAPQYVNSWMRVKRSCFHLWYKLTVKLKVSQKILQWKRISKPL